MGIPQAEFGYEVTFTSLPVPELPIDPNALMDRMRWEAMESSFTGLSVTDLCTGIRLEFESPRGVARARIGEVKTQLENLLKGLR